MNVLKRCFDFSIALALLLLSSPVLLLCALAVKLDSAGPVFFRQYRMGRNFHAFELLKLRTMEHRMSGTSVTLGADPRITCVGRILRKYELDELPQLRNVLRGEMSLVGPRPVIPELTREFHADYERLLTVRPGLTDPATLKYYRECEILAVSADPMKHFKTVVTPDKLQLSAGYLQKASIWSDLRILAQTAKAVIPHISIQIVVTNHDVPESIWKPFAQPAGKEYPDQLVRVHAGAADLMACAEEEGATGD